MIIGIGDIHGGLARLSSDVADGIHGATFVQVGDFGLGFSEPKYEHNQLSILNDILRAEKSYLYVIRGNHDNPAFWINGCGYEFSNIVFVEDNTVLGLDGKQCLFAGGAISIDRTKRLQGVSYWRNEGYEFNEIKLRHEIGSKPIDIVFAHDVPHEISKFTPSNEFVNDWCAVDEALREDLKQSQKEICDLYEFVKSINGDHPFSWVHGHYHSHDVRTTDTVKTYSLAIHELKEIV